MDSEIFKQSIEDLLVRCNLLPLDKWNRFEITHIQPEDISQIQSTKNYINLNVRNKRGIYIYQNSAGETLYVGKGSPLNSRISLHYDACYKPVRGDSKNQKWHRFFSGNYGLLNVHWIEFEDEENRQALEKMLSVILKPKFLKFK
ncbi:hypothetical protein [Paenibacillus sp. HJGM_3]|uniref:hypothetical protein n=1 Tax=Paenibacillus sp. HJGM_3 TaxID=3379816 RepID=UPI00385DFBF1